MNQKTCTETILNDSNSSTVPSVWNATEVSYPHHKVLQQLFEEQVLKTPDSVAISMHDKKLTYNQLNTLSNQLAFFLRKKGITKESIVGVHFERSIEMVVTLYAIIKSGAAYLPIDPEYPDERKLFMQKDSQTGLILTSNKNNPFQNAEFFVYSIEDSDILSLPSSNPPTACGPQNAVYVIYTSGSTGIPKGVINTHAGIVNRLLWMQDCFNINSEDKVLQKTPYSFDVSVWEFFWPLICGAQLVIAEPGSHRDPDYIVETIKKHSISTIHFVPSMLRLFLDAKGVDTITSLKRVICSGEALPFTVQELFFKRIQCPLFNLYGPTEAAVDVTWWKCIKNDSRKIVPIGKPIANIKIYILDEDMKQVPVGTTGELYIGGIGVARGYLNRLELTTERFIPDPFSETETSKLYKTGDLCRYLSDGAIEYLGRIDDQVKIHGFRIELGEIESNILSFQNVHAASAIIKNDSATGDSKIIAYVVIDSDYIPINELRTYLSKHLPEYMIPAQFVKIEKMPLSHNGKTDKKQLPDPPVARPRLQQEYVSPKTETEQKIASIWTQYLNIDKTGIHDQYFDLGGNSIIAVSIADALSKAFNISIPVVTLFQYPTVSAFASYLDLQNPKKTNPSFDNTQNRATLQKNMLRNQKWFNKK